VTYIKIKIKVRLAVVIYEEDMLGRFTLLTFSSKMSYILHEAFNIPMLFESTTTIFHFPGG
jgi:hypothetical protein